MGNYKRVADACGIDRRETERFNERFTMSIKEAQQIFNKPTQQKKTTDQNFKKLTY